MNKITKIFSCVLILGKFMARMTSPQKDFLLIWIWIRITLQVLESFLTIVENQLVRHLDPFKKGFYLSGRISRVATEVKPHED